MNITTYRGDTLTLSVTVTNSSGTPKDITGTVFFTVKKRTDNAEDDTDAVIQKDIEVTNGQDGVITISVSAEETSDLIGEYVYDIQWVSPEDVVTTFLTGLITFKADVTRRITAV